MTDTLAEKLRQITAYDNDEADILFEAADRIEALERAICSYVSTVVSREGVTFIDEQTEDWQKLIYSVCDVRAALEGKNG
jgi:hypothetical protein